jgi:hypothetical protein
MITPIAFFAACLFGLSLGRIAALIVKGQGR